MAAEDQFKSYANKLIITGSFISINCDPLIACLGDEKRREEKFGTESSLSTYAEASGAFMIAQDA